MIAIERICEKVWQILFPKRCPFCGAPIAYEERCCAVCSPILPYLQDIPHFRKDIPLHVPFSYSGIAEQAVWRLKFNGHPAVARHLAPYLAETLPQGTPYDVIVPIPMDRRKERKRGYNQAKLLARYLGQVTGIIVMDCLIKTRKTAEQHTLNARERERNLTGAYQIAPNASLTGKRVLLCDDVITTGATIQEAARVLKIANAKTVEAVAITLAGNEGGNDGII